MDAGCPDKLFVGGLNQETNEKNLKAAFGSFGPIIDVVLIKNWETKQSRGFAFVTFERSADAKTALKDMNGKSLNGKTIKVEQANKRSFKSGNKRRQPPLLKNRGSLRNTRCARRENRAKGHSSRRGNLDDGKYSHKANMSTSRGRFPVKRGPPSRSGGPPPKRSAASARSRSTSQVGRRGSEARGRDNFRVASRRAPVSSRRNDYVAPKDGNCSTKDSASYSRRVHASSRDTKDGASPPRDYRYRRYRRHSLNQHSSKEYSDRDGYGRGRYRDYSEHPSGNTYRVGYESHGRSRGAASTKGNRQTHDGSRRYDSNNIRDRYVGNRGNYSSRRSDTYLNGHDYGGRQKRGSPFSVDRMRPVSRELHSSSKCVGSRGGQGESRGKKRD